MLRRDFLKNSIGALLGVALTSNKALASIVETLTPESPKVLLYLIQTTSGVWKVKATKWVDLYKSKRLKPCEVKKETFQALDIVDYEDATKRKYELWKQYNCSGKLTPVRIIEDTIAGKKSLTSKNYIDYLNSDKFKEIMKIRLIAANKASKNMSEEQRKILSEIHKGKKHTEESRRKISQNRKGIKHTEESRKKLSDSHKGKKISEEHKNKLHAGNIGKKRTDETRKKISDAQQNNKLIICYSYPNMNFIKEYVSISSTSRDLNIDQSSITKICTKKRISAKGYTFRYKDNITTIV
jgi:hypothetical protein